MTEIPTRRGTPFKDLDGADDAMDTKNSDDNTAKHTYIYMNVSRCMATEMT